MLLWETIQYKSCRGERVRLPGDVRCSAVTRSGARCKGRARNDSDYCVFHDPSIDLQARRRAAKSRGQKAKRSPYHLDGVPSRLTTRKGITAALDRLYNDTRLGLVSPEGGRVLFDMLERLLETHTTVRRRGSAAGGDRSKATRLRRKLAKIYIQTEARYRTGRAAQSVARDATRAAEVPAGETGGNGESDRIKLPSLDRVRASAAKWSAEGSVPATTTA